MAIISKFGTLFMSVQILCTMTWTWAVIACVSKIMLDCSRCHRI